MSRARLLAVFTGVLAASNALAWNGFGHMTVAAIAYHRLTPAARDKVATLLKLNPDYDQWVAGVPAEQRDEVAFIVAATWPDAIKSMQGYTNDGEDPSGPDASRNLGYEDKLQHRYWHYVDMPFAPDGTPLIQPAPPNAQTQIAVFRKALGSPDSSDALKSYDLVWLLHLVGDVHQPLHCTSRFNKEQPQGDHGGNSVALCAAPCRDGLHAFWDELLGTSKSPEAAETAAAKISAPSAKLAKVKDESKWVDEGFRAARKSVYRAPVGIGPGPFTLTQKYKLQASKVASVRVGLAGARLAKLINEAFQ